MHDVIPNAHLRAGQEVQATTPSGFRSPAVIADLTDTQVTLETAEHGRETFSRLTVLAYTPERVEWAWCPECRTRREVEDRHDEGQMTRRGEETCTVTDFSCGHSTATDPVITYAAPGAPYAGPDAVVARSTSARDLRQAREEQARRDARQGE